MEKLYTERGSVQKQLAGEADSPWSLALVTFIAFFLPAGGAVLAVRNMARMGEIDARRSIELTVALLAVFAAGYSALLLAAQPSPSQPSDLSPAVTALLSIGTAGGTFLFQRTDFLEWRRDHPQAQTARWYGAIGWGIVYQLLTAIIAIPFFLLLAVITSIGA
jgi:hypothetical protein